MSLGSWYKTLDLENEYPIFEVFYPENKGKILSYHMVTKPLGFTWETVMNTDESGSEAHSTPLTSESYNEINGNAIEPQSGNEVQTANQMK